MINRFNSSCKGASFNVAPCHSREYYHVPRGTNVETSLLNKKEVSEVFVPLERETDIRALVDAGVTPAFVPCSTLLAPSSVAYQSEQGELKAAEIIQCYCEREKELEKEQTPPAQSGGENPNPNSNE